MTGAICNLKLELTDIRMKWIISKLRCYSLICQFSYIIFFTQMSEALLVLNLFLIIKLTG